MKKSLIVSTGFALFSMFFGSGNLVFPLIVGQESQMHFGWAALGMFLTGVIVPFLGVMAMMLFKGDSNRFFETMGKPATFWVPLVVLSLMGPFGVLARCVTVAHGSFSLLFPNVSLTLFSLAFCSIIFVISLNKPKLVTLLGTFLTPFLLVSLAAIGVFGVWNSAPPAEATMKAFDSFQNGFFKGYQMMDLLASFFFSTVVIQHLAHHLPDTTEKQRIKPFLLSAGIGAGLLSLVYMVLIFLGAVYAPSLAGVPPQALLGVVAQQALGSFSAPIVCVAIILACFTTAVVLAVLFADFFRLRVTRNHASNSMAMGFTLIVAFLVSTLDFGGIAKFLGPVVEAIYPALIMLTLLNIATALWGMKQRKWPVLATLVAKLCWF